MSHMTFSCCNSQQLLSLLLLLFDNFLLLLQIHCMKMELGDDPIISGYKELEDVLKEMKQWKAELKMEVQICNDKDNFLTEHYEQVEILQYTAVIWKGFQLFFDPLKFPSNDGFKDSKGWKELHHVLWMQVQCNGYDIVLNGCISKKFQINIKICCHKSITYYYKKQINK